MVVAGDTPYAAATIARNNPAHKKSRPDGRHMSNTLSSHFRKLLAGHYGGMRSALQALDWLLPDFVAARWSGGRAHVKKILDTANIHIREIYNRPMRGNLSLGIIQPPT